MDLLAESSEWKLQREDWPMFTRERPVLQGLAKKRNLHAPSSLVHDYCALEGIAERSVIFSGTEIGRYSRIKDSVIMPGAKIGRNVHIERAIIGEGAVIKDGAVIKAGPGDISVVAPFDTVFAKPMNRPQPSRLLQEVYDNAPRLRAEGLLS